MGNHKMGLTGIMIGAIAVLQAANVASTTYTVGDNIGWTIPSKNSVGFYESWASNKTFYIGDLFNWTGTHDAVEVANEEEYKKCSKTGTAMIANGQLVPLKANGTRYFLCSVGSHCELGMKVAIKVGNGSISPPPPPVSPSAAPSLAVGSSLAAIFSSIAILFLKYVKHS